MQKAEAVFSTSTCELYYTRGISTVISSVLYRHIVKRVIIMNGAPNVEKGTIWNRGVISKK